MSSCSPSNVYDNSPYVKLPNQPNVKYSYVQLPKVPEGATLEEREKIAKKLIVQYRINEAKNAKAYHTRENFYINLQNTYNKNQP